MPFIRQHITRSIALLLLLAAGVLMVQMHDMVHLAEDMIVSADHQEETPDTSADHKDCLNCILLFAATELTTSFSVFSCFSTSAENTPTKAYISSAPTAWFSLRAPPAV